MKIEQAAGGQRNVTFRLSGILTSIEQFELKTGYTQLKLASLAWLIEEKHEMYLGWSYDTILLPMESRNSLKLANGIPSPKGWDGSLWLTPMKIGEQDLPKAFFIILDFDK